MPDARTHPCARAHTHTHRLEAHEGAEVYDILRVPVPWRAVEARRLARRVGGAGLGVGRQRDCLAELLNGNLPA